MHFFWTKHAFGMLILASFSLTAKANKGLGEKPDSQALNQTSAWHLDAKLRTASIEPIASPTQFSGANIMSFKFDVTFKGAVPAVDGYLVVWKKDKSPIGDPVDGKNYTIGDAIGDGKVGYIGNDISYTQKGSIEAGSNYFYKIYSFNGLGNAVDYKSTYPLTGMITSSSNMMGNYYIGCDSSSEYFLDSLQARIRRQTSKISYANYTKTMIADFCYRDTANGQRVISCVYSGDQYSFTNFSWYTVGTFSREHTYCHSWMPTYNSTSGPEYSDQHHLFPTEQAHANGPRSNHPLGIVTAIYSTYYLAKLGNNANGKLVYEPQDKHKGNTARALLYMAVRYHGLNGKDWSFNQLNKNTLVALNEDSQSVALLLRWHAEDPVDSYEVARNDYIYSIQGNRNPFIDHPEYIEKINFHDISYSKNGSGADEIQMNVQRELSDSNIKIQVTPNPIKDQIILNMESRINHSSVINIYNLEGKLVWKQFIKINQGFNSLTIDSSPFASGIYYIKLDCHSTSVKVIKE